MLLERCVTFSSLFLFVLVTLQTFNVSTDAVQNFERPVLMSTFILTLVWLKVFC